MQVPLFAQVFLLEHGSIRCEQVKPENHAGQIHIKLSKPSIQLPPCKQGFEAHLFI
ncbi:unnamed protein product, partial [Rotaria magnacalcarata]